MDKLTRTFGTLLLALAAAAASAATPAAQTASTTATAATSAAPAAQAHRIDAESALEKRVYALTEQLRCLVCQNQTIADSHAELAIDLKNQVRQKLAAGESEKDIVNYMVARYGDFVLYRPPVKATTWLLWFGPLLMLVAGLGVLLTRLKRRRLQGEELSDEDRRRAALLLASSE